ncbi:hypothetical protein [Chryseobacterium sp.]|jgi:hypothetical protein|uniref:hypothetical protein n=1 Tax=Chryseobacterium sp. TaxID=1871047 RepID=UPI00283B5D9A|nr:hypothetical protein [Chryseobacterium sp.]MDR3026039.1 hypothetical protein [Chryseobacterium sp.]
MENQEEIERLIIEKVKADHKISGGANGSDLNDLDKIINLPIPERNELLDRMVREKKIAYQYPLNAKKVTLPK